MGRAEGVDPHRVPARTGYRRRRPFGSVETGSDRLTCPVSGSPGPASTPTAHHPHHAQSPEYRAAGDVSHPWSSYMSVPAWAQLFARIGFCGTGGGDDGRSSGWAGTRIGLISRT